MTDIKPSHFLNNLYALDAQSVEALNTLRSLILEGDKIFLPTSNLDFSYSLLELVEGQIEELKNLVWATMQRKERLSTSEAVLPQKPFATERKEASL